MSIGRTSQKLDDRAAAAPQAAPVSPARALALVGAERDAVLRGLVHALSNRVGTVTAVTAMLDPAGPAAAVAVSVLQGEGERLEALLGEFRLLCAEPATAPEPLHVPELARGVAALHAHHPTLRDVPCTIDEAPELAPAVADPTAVGEALLAALGAAKRAAGAAGVRVWCEGDAAEVRVHVHAVDADGAPEAATPAIVHGPGDVVWSLGGGAAACVHAAGGTLRLPTLAAARGASPPR